ncbi:MAG: hypothetical protein M1826_006285 [Phylliscum demangeonii]|nr:MAG: hypothetical protein M1826_006285 [Phylliscum demangeonii]
MMRVLIRARLGALTSSALLTLIQRHALSRLRHTLSQQHQQLLTHLHQHDTRLLHLEQSQRDTHDSQGSLLSDVWATKAHFALLASQLEPIVSRALMDRLRALPDVRRCIEAQLHLQDDTTPLRVLLTWFEWNAVVDACRHVPAWSSELRLRKGLVGMVWYERLPPTPPPPTPLAHHHHDGAVAAAAAVTHLLSRGAASAQVAARSARAAVAVWRRRGAVAGAARRTTTTTTTATAHVAPRVRIMVPE